ncbi:MAG: YggT family protein [Chitinivibrionales bacterium]
MILYKIVSIYEVIILIRVFMSWINPDPSHPFVYWISKITDPVLEPVRRLLPSNSMGFDFSPIIVMILLEFLKSILWGGF